LVGGLWIRNQLESLDEIAAKLTRSPDPIVWKASVSPTRRILNKVPLDSSKTSICHSAFCLRLRKTLPIRSPQTLVISTHAASRSARSKALSDAPLNGRFGYGNNTAALISSSQTHRCASHLDSAALKNVLWRSRQNTACTGFTGMASPTASRARYIRPHQL
jgi:hypothetical protein